MLKSYLKFYLKQKRNSNAGFTLIELLVVVIIIGILSAISLPNFLNQTGKARQAEAKTYLGTFNRAQQAYFTEKSSFAKTIKDLGVDVPDSTDNYSYSLLQVDGSKAIAIAKPVEGATYKGYLAVAALINPSTNPSIRTALCESVGTGTAAELTTSDVAIATDSVSCTGNSVAVK